MHAEFSPSSDFSEQEPLCSIIIPAYNAVSHLEDQLLCLKEQRQAPPFEVIVCDNGRNFGLDSIIRRFSTSLDIRRVDATAIPGPAYARNCGAQKAKGKYLLFCDADDFVSTAWVRNHARALAENQNCLVRGDIQNFDFSASPDKMRQVALNYVHQIINYEVKPYTFKRYALPYSLFTAANLSIAKEYFLQLSGFDTSYNGGGEDLDFGWRAQIELQLTPLFVEGAHLSRRSRGTWQEIFWQQYRYSHQDVLLWQRFRHFGMQAFSTKYSLLRAPILLAKLPVLLVHGLGGSPQLGAWAQELGGNIGTLKGVWLYRIKGLTPSRSFEPFRSS